MRSNSNRGRRLAFGTVGEMYAARPDVPSGIFDWCAHRTGLERSQTVVEIGAGTGQLTRHLLAAGARVIAAEPAAEFCSILQQEFAGDDLDTVNSVFEDVCPTEPVAAVWSANAFHWVEPGRGSAHAHRMLQPSGSIALIWTFLVIDDPGLAALIAAGRLGGEHVNFGTTDPAAFVRGFEESASEGREELTRDGLFEDVAWEHQIDELAYPGAGYADLVMTFANTAALGADQRVALHNEVSVAIDELKLDSLTFQHHAYAVVARAAQSR